MADKNIGDNAILRMETWIAGTNASGNYNNLGWRLSLIERTPSVYGWSGSVGASVEVFWDGGGYTVPWSGSFAFDFRPSGQQSVVIASGVLSGMGNFGDGSPRTFTFRGNIGNTGTSTVGPANSVDQAIAGAQTKLTPNTPSTPTATYVSDTQVNLAWTQSNPSNGQPYSNQVYCKDNNGAEFTLLDISATNSAVVGTAANHKYEFRVSAWGNGTGFSGKSGWSSPVFTTPGAPSSATAVKNASQDIVINFVPTVAYAEHTHEVWHGTVSGGVTTWDASPLTTLSSGVTSYTHVSPNSAQVHVYRVRAKAGTLTSAYATTGSVQLLAAPNKPGTPAMPSFANKAAALVFEWTHNPVDTTPQTAYEFSTSTNGGTSWSSTGKITSTAQSRTIAANTYAANVAVTTRVRTWGQATSGGSDGTGASPWSDLRTVTMKTIPVATVSSPANGSTVNDATLKANVGFSQSEGASFVKAQLELLQGATVLETLESNIQVGITFAAKGANSTSYTVRARVLDSNGLWSNWATSTFSVSYLAPVPASVFVTYLENTGYGQLNLTIPSPGGGQAAATLVSILRTINGVEEVVVADYPVSSSLTFLDTTPTINGINSYKIITKSALGAQTVVTTSLITSECKRAFLSKGAGFSNVIVFGGNLKVDEGLAVASSTIVAAGRTKPIGLYGVETNVQLKVVSRIFENFGSSIDAIRAFLLVPGKACYRDASGRRVFGSVKGSLKYDKVTRGDLSFTITETS